MHGMDVENDAKMNNNHTPIPSFCSSPSKMKEKEKKILTKLLYHFRKWHDWTEHVQQAVKPLGYPRGGVSWGFSADCTHKIHKEIRKNVSEKILIHIFQELYLIL